MQRQPGPEQPLRYWFSGDLDAVDRHVNIGGENGDQEQDQTPGGETASCGKEQTKGPGGFGDTTHIDQEARRGQLRRNDLNEDAGFTEMQDASANKEGRQQEKRDPLEQVRPLYDTSAECQSATMK